MFKTVLLFIINSLFLFALDLPTSIESKVVSINGNNISVSGNIPKGMAGIVIHSYGKGLEAITHSVVSLGGNRALVKRYNGLDHDNIPKIKTPLNSGDRVVFGNLYKNILLIAPSERVYSKIVKLSSNRFWIHPDLYAYYLIEEEEDRVTIKNLREFSIKNLVGLVVIIAKDGLRVLDPISGKYLSKLPLNMDIKRAKLPFYSRFDGIDNASFSKASSNYLSKYFKLVEGIK